MSFDHLIGNRKIRAGLQRAIQNRRLPHALLFGGPAGVGKRTFALAVAQALNCVRANGDACGDCPSCLKIERGEHLDVSLIELSTKQIKVDEIRALRTAAQMRPFEGRYRIFIVDPADAMNAQAQNALLKTLEEPPDHTVLILIAERPDMLAPTIRSRCQRLVFAPLAPDEVLGILSSKMAGSQPELQLRVRLSRGRVGAAVSFDLDLYLRTRAECLAFLQGIGRPIKVAALLEWSAAWGRDMERDPMLHRLGVLQRLLDDLNRLAVGADPESLTNIDLFDELLKLSSQWPLARIEKLAHRLAEFERGLARNVNRQLGLEYAGLTFDRRMLRPESDIE